MQPLKRITAYIIDMCIVGLYIGLLVAVGLTITYLGHHSLMINNNFKRAVAQLGAFFVLTLPTTVWFAVWEYRAHATPGKRLMGLRVVANNGESLSFRRAFLRSVIKVLIPWELAHAAVWRLVTIHGTGQDIVAYVLLGSSYLIVLLNLILLFLPSRKLLHDMVAGTIVSYSDRKVHFP